MDVAYPGPHQLLLPIKFRSEIPDEYFVDGVWIMERLVDLFVNVRVDDNNFKGTALENVVRSSASMPISNSRLIAEDGSSKQIDASFDLPGDRLLIAECRAWSRSIGFERGQPEAIDQRIKKMDQTLRDVDEKARWLANNPVGRNYDIRRFKEVIGIGVSPFVQYVPSLFEWYWLKRDVPRLLTPEEVKTVVHAATADTQYYHGVGIRQIGDKLGDKPE